MADGLMAIWSAYRPWGGASSTARGADREEVTKRCMETVPREERKARAQTEEKRVRKLKCHDADEPPCRGAPVATRHRYGTASPTATRPARARVAPGAA